MISSNELTSNNAAMKRTASRYLATLRLPVEFAMSIGNNDLT